MTADSVVAAHQRIREHIHRTPVLRSRLLDERSGCQLLFKAENLQKVGAFKARGATNAVLSSPETCLPQGFVTHSSGNHGAALAYAAGIAGAPVHVVMPEDSVPSKIEAVRGYGAQLTLCKPTLEARDHECQRLLEETGGTLIHPYDADEIIAGQGTAALEFFDQVPRLDAIMTPIGGGGLISGTALYAKARHPQTKVFGAEPANSADAYDSWRLGKHVAPKSTDTIADGLRAGIGAKNFECIQKGVDEVFPVTEASILEATRWLMHTLKTVVEPSAAVPMAAIMEHPEAFRSKTIGIILSGGNLDLEAPPWLVAETAKA